MIFNVGQSKYSSLSIVLPALNEEGVVGNTVRTIDKQGLVNIGFDIEVIVVDNNSDDKTSEEARDAGAKVFLEKKRGYGSAYLRGLKEATGDIIVIGDADGTYPLDQTSDFIQPILDGDADFVIGSRLKGKIHDGAMPRLHRYIGNPLLSRIANFLFKTQVSDFHCGMRAFTREALKKMKLETLGMEFATEMVVEANRKNLRIKEIPINYYPRGGGEAKINSFKDGWRHLRYMFLYSPDYLFLLPGGISFTSGILLMILMLRDDISLFGINLFIHPMVLGSLLALLGLNLLLIGYTAKTFAIEQNLIKNDRFITFIERHFSLEKGLLMGLVLVVIGSGINIQILYKWYSTNFGALSTLKIAIFASTLVVMGMQIIFSSWFIGIIGIKKKKI
jgi:glycosyltransferase involved in cell wall biosynthesis